MKTLKKTTKTYAKAMATFNKQFGNVTEITKLYVNADGQIYAGEWLDSTGQVNFNSNYLPDCAQVITIK